MKISIQKLALLAICAGLSPILSAQSICADPSNIYSFSYNGANYEVVKENKTWVDAAACAVDRGGFLAEIDDQAEQDAIYAELGSASITNSNTVAPDGGGASYVWIGGNDLGTEGEWIWDGDNDGSGNQFWQGTASGTVVGGLYNNWGNEPDNFGSGQDGLGLALTSWPFGSAGQWNDVADLNTLYYVIEYPSTAGTIDNEQKNIAVYPVPSSEQVTITAEIGMNSMQVYSVTGEEVELINLSADQTYVLDISNYLEGIYILQITLENGDTQSHKIVR